MLLFNQKLRVQYTEQITLHYQHPNSEAASKYNLVMDSQHKKSFLYYQGSSELSTFFAPDKNEQLQQTLNR